MKKTIALLLFIVTGIGTIPLLQAQSFQDTIKQVDSLLLQYRADEPGASLTVSRKGQVIFQKHVGISNMEYNIPITDSTIFEAGSVSKQFTATAILLLVQDGKINLDDPVKKHIPELPDYPETITVRHLMNHTSGLKDWGSLAGLGGWPRGTREYTNDLALDYIIKQPTLNHVPGGEYIYSNSNYTLLTIIAERLSGQKLPDFTQERILGPLGMVNTSWRDDHKKVVKGRATGYSESKKGFETDMPFENTYGHAALLTTTKDLDTWNRSWANSPLGNDELLHLRTATGMLNDGTPITYASAVMVDSFLSHPRVYHTGSTAGYRALLTYYPNEDLSIAFLSNNSSTNVSDINKGLAAIFFGKDPRDTGNRALQTETAPTQNLKRSAGITGHYESTECGGAVQVLAEGDSVWLSMKHGRQLSLKQVGIDSFYVANRQTTYAFKRDESGQVIGLYASVPRARNVWFARNNKLSQ